MNDINETFEVIGEETRSYYCKSRKKVRSKHYYICKCKKCGWETSRTKSTLNKSCNGCRVGYYTTKTFIEKAKEVHNNFYSYSNVKYRNNSTKIIITCPVHGEFQQSPSEHLRGKGCHECGNKKSSDKRKVPFSKRLDKIYSLFNSNITINEKYSECAAHDKIIATCSKHGQWETNFNSLCNGHGCPKCNASHGERTIRNWLNRNNIFFTEQKKFDSCKNIKPLPFDFFIPSKNTLIEFDGEQHFKPYRFSNQNKMLEKFNKQKLNDSIKDNWVSKSDYTLLRIKYNEKIEEKLSNLFSI